MLLRFKSLPDIYVIKKIPVDKKMQTNDLKARKNILCTRFLHVLHKIKCITLVSFNLPCQKYNLQDALKHDVFYSI